MSNVKPQSNSTLEMEARQIKLELERQFPRIEADIKVDGRTIWGTIYTKDKNILGRAYNRSMGNVACRASNTPYGSVARFEYFVDRTHQTESLVHRLVEPKFEGFSRMYGTYVDAKVDQSNIRITITSWEFRDLGNHRERACAIIEEMRDEVLKMSGCKYLSIYTCDDREVFPVYVADCDDDDDDPRSPNWPSKNDGMPSGGGRDNNPPK